MNILLGISVKGLAIQQIFWILVVVIVIAVVFMVFIKEHLLASEEGEEFSALFGKEILSTSGHEELEIESSKVGTNYQYTVRVENLNFYYKILEEEEKELKFIAVADFKKRVAIAKEGNEYKIINYPEDENVILNFELESTKGPENKEFLHLTFWSDSKCVEDFFEEGGEDLYDLLAKCPGDYISSVDVVEGRGGRALHFKLDPEDNELFQFNLIHDPEQVANLGTCDQWTRINREHYINCDMKAKSLGYDGGLYVDAADDNVCTNLHCIPFGYQTGVYIGDSRPYGSTHFCCACNGFNPLNENYCIIFAHNENDLAPDDCALTTVAPGSLISNRYINLRGGLVDAVVRPHASGEYILDYGWIDDIQNMGECENYCDDELLTGSTGNFNYRPEIDILCDSNGYWIPCYSLKESEVITAGGQRYNCTNGGWVVQ
jgi:hypothetical protein